MTEYEILVAALRKWNATQNTAWRVAGELLIETGHWLREKPFVVQCVFTVDGVTYVDWETVGQLLERQALIGTGAELAVLRIAAMIANGEFGASSIDEVNSVLVVTAVAAALGVPVVIA